MATTRYVWTQWVFFTMAILALVTLRWLEPELDRPYRVWLIVPALFVGISVFMVRSHPLPHATTASTITLTTITPTPTTKQRPKGDPCAAGRVSSVILFCSLRGLAR
jgi:amino acid transporter